MAIDWTSEAALARDGAAFAKFMHVLFGIYAWEWFTSLGFEWSLLTGKKSFRWPHIFYFLGRYCLLAALAATVASLNLTHEVDCSALYHFIQMMGGLAIALASDSLALRTIALWKGNYYVMGSIIAAMLAHWGLVFRISVVIQAIWVDRQGCAIINNNASLITATYAYTMCFDLFILVLTAWKLGIKAGSQSRLVHLLWYDGLIYFIVAFLANLTALVFAILDLNAVMSVVADVPATTIAMIAAMRAVRRLSDFRNDGAELYQTPKSSAYSTTFRVQPPRSNISASRPENLQIQMDVITKDEYESEDYARENDRKV